jgi:two-component system nitrogen regulation sensor histidine kinase NtrY
VEAVIRLDPEAEVYLYVSRRANPAVLASIEQSSKAARDYQAVLDRSRALQFRFNAVLLLVSLLIVGLSIWIALALADRLVRPVGALVGAARRVTAGDLTARVPVGERRDEVGTLGDAFNRMTQRLEEQTGALVSANAQLDTRRVFTEAVLAGVTAGVLSVDEEGRIRLINRSAEDLLKAGEESPVGRNLGDLAPELGEFVAGDAREATVEVAQDGQPRTLAVKRVRVTGGTVLTFDDITDQLLDQRTAAWSDVARRIAHEIKNPLTPIQLAAERLQRRYGKQIVDDPQTFARLTSTIIRQVGDLRRMVDEFSGFARLPKPVFRSEAIADIAREALFLHEVAHPGIRFALDVDGPEPFLICDRRQIGQALTNLVKNGVEAIEAQRSKGGPRAEGEAITMHLSTQEQSVVLEVCDTGVGLPIERARLTEPYVTTRARGTGLGLAIVKKIVEEHGGEMSFHDRPGGGSRVRLCFDTARLARLDVDDVSGGRVTQMQEAN